MMKKKILKAGLATILVLAGTNLVKAQQFGDNLGSHKATKDLQMNTQKILNTSGLAIGTVALTNTSIALQIDATDKAILIPRVLNNALIVAPLNGMIIYNTTDNKFYLYQNNAWVTFAMSIIDSVTGINTTGNANGYTLTQVGQDMVIKLSPATATTPGVVSTTAQTFGGEKTFGGNAIVNGTLTVKGTVTSVDNKEAMLVVDKITGEVRKSTLSPASISTHKLRIPTVLLGSNESTKIVITGIAGLIKNGGVVINFDADDLAANAELAYISILNTIATADGEVTVTVADMRQYDGTTALSNAGTLLTGKHFTLTNYKVN